MPTRLELNDIQGLLVRGYGKLRAARYVLLEIVAPRLAAAWLAATSSEVADGRQRPEERALNLAFTPAGLAKLGLPEQTLGGFSLQFVGGMTTEHRRRLLGDVDDSAPEYWTWGGPASARVDLLLLAYARDASELDRAVAVWLPDPGAAGLRVVRTLETAELRQEDHFGFRDSISQPRLEGLGPAPFADSIKPGEFVLGYRNEYGQLTQRPLVPVTSDPHGLLLPDVEGSGERDLGRNGSYLVFRHLRQDVRAFWEFCDRATRRGGGSSDAEARVRLASKMIGRWPSGAPLVLAPDTDRPELATANEFGYFAADRYGLRCPIGSHVRRAHPRDSKDPAPGTQRSIAVDKLHRLLRRGREYGDYLSPEERLAPPEPDELEADPRGLHFICLVGNIARQFEFVQHTWLNDPRFLGLYDNPDPLLSPAPAGGRSFTVPAEPVRVRYTGLPRFVSVRGGGYFFLPGIRALRYLATLAS